MLSIAKTKPVAFMAAECLFASSRAAAQPRHAWASSCLCCWWSCSSVRVWRWVQAVTSSQQVSCLKTIVWFQRVAPRCRSHSSNPPDPEDQLSSAGIWDKSDVLCRSFTKMTREGLLGKHCTFLPRLLEIVGKIRVSELELVISLVKTYPPRWLRKYPAANDKGKLSLGC